ncbi:transcriptional regulator, GntR family [Jatrophihabitans endophyticus]|uniref:Transcriptional regulator, GntR family n=1 Tax=Jatrophihabitans endophyticus TaxID=1206085 RepID=A0A1M5PSV4_9ACTN|nr:GntR family transcriptional regulator [Jatrophihabitans endophyticus]SHH04934.1 transcriptional regulator, GntR family [Jatrophihabitans endophyticus]
MSEPFGPMGTRIQPRLAEAIAAELRERILNGSIPEGALPKQEDLVVMFGVSAPPMREALRILEVEGLITVRRGKLGGAVVHRPNGGSMAHAIGMALQGEQVHLHDLAESIRDLEPRSAAACAQRADRKDVLRPRFEENLELSAAAVGDGPAFTRVSRTFHELVVAYTTPVTTRLLIRSLVTIWTAQEQTWAHEASEVGHYPTKQEQRTVLNAHRRIATRILDGDAAGAERSARAHLHASQDRVLAEFGDRVVDAASSRAIRGLRSVTTDQRSDAGYSVL